MKKKLVASLAAAMVLGVAGTSFAAVNPFSDVPAKHWSYDALGQLSKAGIVEGYGDGTFKGDKTISRYEMAIIVAKAMSKSDKADAANKALIEKLSTEYSSELDKLGARMDKVETKVDALGSIKFNGFTRAKYDSDSASDSFGNRNISGGNKHFYMDFEGQMKVNDSWTANFQSETRKDYTSTSWTGSNGAAGPSDEGQDGTIQRIWLNGHVGKVGVTVGQKWWGYASNVLYGHAAEGIQIDVPVGDQVTASVFNLKPSQGSLTTGSLGMSYDPVKGKFTQDASHTDLRGISINAALSKAVNLNVVAGSNKKDEASGISNWQAIDVSAKLGNDFKLTGTYAKTNADATVNGEKLNSSQEFRLDYKGADIQKPNSYGIYARYVKFQLYGDISHDDEWSSLPGDMKGWVLGVDYVLAKNVQWTTLYSDQKINLSGTGAVSGTGFDKEAKRKLFRTEVDFHF